MLCIDLYRPFLLEDEDENKEQNTDESTKKCTKEQASYETENQLSRRASRQSNTQTDNNTDEHIEIQTDRRSGGADDDIYQNTAETKIYEDLCSVRRSLQNSEVGWKCFFCMMGIPVHIDNLSTLYSTLYCIGTLHTFLHHNYIFVI